MGAYFRARFPMMTSVWLPASNCVDRIMPFRLACHTENHISMAFRMQQWHALTLPDECGSLHMWTSAVVCSSSKDMDESVVCLYSGGYMDEYRNSLEFRRIYGTIETLRSVSYTHLRAHETRHD